jgi:hypothetical protein
MPKRCGSDLACRSSGPTEKPEPAGAIHCCGYLPSTTSRPADGPDDTGEMPPAGRPHSQPLPLDPAVPSAAIASRDGLSSRGGGVH